METDKDKKKEDRSICRAMIQTSTAEGWDFECVAVPAENGQLRRSYENDEYFLQVLGVKSENIDTSRLDSGLPLFDNHPWELSAMNTLGISVGYDITDAGLVIRCKFGARAEEELKLDVKNGIIKTVSIEGEINNYEITRKLDEIPIYYADLWTPESLSFAPVPQDIGAQIDVKRAIQKQIKDKTAVEPGKSTIKSLINKF